MNGKEILEQLNTLDECNYIEAKKGSKIDRSILETVCAFCNEPGIDGGYIILGVVQKVGTFFPSYIVSGVENPDKLQLDLSTQCASAFNIPVRPSISLEQMDEQNIMVIHISELPDVQKPVYFKNEGLPRGAYRRIGSSDQRCTDDDLYIFYNNEDSLDHSINIDSSWEDISEEAIDLYRYLRSKVNPYAEELQYSDVDLMHSLGCLKKVNDKMYFTYAGLLLFGKRHSHRRLLPMVRVDYIRIPGNTWIEDPENRFTTIDMRGGLLEMVQRVFSQITDDLPKGFLLSEGELQASNTGLPSRVLREAIVNALIHRTYRVNQPIQIIRYGNRIEIKNPGFSLKPEEHLGEPGSKNRNPYIAAVFHETNLAETKGSGIRTMRSLMKKANLLPPTFESDHGRNQFTSRLLFHHFLDKTDINWLSQFDKLHLSEGQKSALIFVREVGAIDNKTYRQIIDCDTLKASAELRALKSHNLLKPRGKGKATYYVTGSDLITPANELTTPANELTTPANELITPANELTTPPIDILPDYLTSEINALGKRVNEARIVKDLILKVCAIRPFSAAEIASFFNKEERYFKRQYLSNMVRDGELQYTIQEMINHPNQAYRLSNTQDK